MTPDRRHEDHPHPPPGAGERRKCSDLECMAARTAWLDETIWPALADKLGAREEKILLRIRIETAVMIGMTVIFCAGVFAWFDKSSMTSHELDTTSKYVSIPAHTASIARIEASIAELRQTVISSLAANKDEILSRLDRNLVEIKERKR